MNASRNVVITGANTGIGAAVARELARAGAHLLLCCRDLAKGGRVRDEIRQQGATAECVALDLSDLNSVRAAAQQLRALAPKLDVLINNAGLAGSKGTTRQGFELTFGVNHLGHFLLTELLLENLLTPEPGRVINVASTAHYKCPGIDFAALRESTRSRSGFAEYRVSKLANILHAKELARRYGPQGLRAVSIHPGVVRSDVWRQVPQPFRTLIKLFMRSNEQGAATITKRAACAANDLSNGAYYHELQLREPSRLASDPQLAKQLWDKSAEWVKL